MKRLLLLSCAVFSFLLVESVSAASTTSLRVQPLHYKDQLSTGEKKKGFIDIGNPTNETLRLVTSVQGFRQIDDSGKLHFFNDEQIATGLTPDLKEFELGPREALRLYFLIDGTKLPTGDIFAALFVTASSKAQTSGVSQPVRLGTLFSIINGTPGPRNAVIEELDTSFVHFSNGIRGSYLIRNAASPDKATGFYPTVLVTVAPFAKQKLIDSSLIFAGRTRENTFEIPSDRIGIYKVTVQYQDSSKSKWILVITGIWRWIVLAAVALGALVLLHRLRGYRGRTGLRKR